MSEGGGSCQRVGSAISSTDGAVKAHDTDAQLEADAEEEEEEAAAVNTSSDDNDDGGGDEVCILCIGQQ
jgi:hypothetical protein